MKRMKAFIVLSFATNILQAQNSIDVLHYKFELNLNNNNDTIHGCAEIKLRFHQAVTSFSIDLTTQNSRGQGMKVDSVITGQHRSLNFISENDKVKITPDRLSKLNDSSLFIIYYHGVPKDGLIISKNRYGDRTFFADNWPNRAHNWIPCKDQPDDKATFEFIVTAPLQFQVVSNGKLVEEKLLANNNKLTHWVEDVSLPTKVMVIGVAKFAIKEFIDSPPNVPISAWVFPQDSVRGFKNYSPAPAIVKFYSDYIGPYPYNKLANVQSKTIFGGMENASAIFYDQESAEEHTSIEDLLAHEIAHQWFGDMATEKSFSHLWLSEGFATYMSDIYLESKYGTDTMNYLLRHARRKVIDFSKGSAGPVVDSISPLMRLLNANSYEKGAWVLHMLRKRMGDSTFRLFIRKYYDRFKGKNADTEDLRKVAEEVTGKNMEQFFKQWLYTAGIPKLATQSQFNKQTNELSVTIKQVQKEIFQFPLEVEIESETQKAKITTIPITNRVETFKFKVEKKLLRFNVDPNTSLLFEEIKN